MIKLMRQVGEHLHEIEVDENDIKSMKQKGPFSSATRYGATESYITTLKMRSGGTLIVQASKAEIDAKIAEATKRT